MHLSDHDLRQINEDDLRKLSVPPLLELSIKLLADLEDARDRLNRNPQNSSQPPSTQSPWEKTATTKDEDCAEVEDAAVVQSNSPAEPVHTDVSNDKLPDEGEPNQTEVPERALPTKGRPGRKPGTPGESRTQKLPITDEQTHHKELRLFSSCQRD